MSTFNKVKLQLFFLLGLPALGGLLIFKFGLVGLFIYLFLGVIWCWEVYVFAQYRFCRQEEFVNVLQAAAATQMPMEAMLRAYLEDRPRDGGYHGWVFFLMLFVFPGYFLIHRGRSFDSQLMLVLALLDHGVPLDRALRFVPQVVSRQTALAVTVGQLTGQLPQALRQMPEQRSKSPWLELAPRLIYPLLVLVVLAANVAFLAVFIIPKFEKIFADFKMRVPDVTNSFFGLSGWLTHHSWIVPNLVLFLLLLINVEIFDSRAKWHTPIIGRIYRMHARGQFLQTLGIMMDSGKPLPEILAGINESGLLPKAIAVRSQRLAADISRGEPLAESLTKHGLSTASLGSLIAAAERARNLPWALRELGETLIRRSARLSHRLAMILFPLAIFACASLVGLFAVAMFSPLTALLRGMMGG
jgi:type II secretory pathway component PulF